MKIYTKKGDAGKTALFGGTRVSKSDLRIDAYGTIDELNSFLGLVSDCTNDIEMLGILRAIQERLFTIGAALAADPKKNNLKKPDLLETDVELLERTIDSMNEKLPPLKNFILPGGHPAVSFTHMARCVCRRAERLVVALSEREHVDEIVLKYLNRLSDFLFVYARWIGDKEKIVEIPWVPRQ